MNAQPFLQKGVGDFLAQIGKPLKYRIVYKRKYIQEMRPVSVAVRQKEKRARCNVLLLSIPTLTCEFRV